MTKTKYLKYNIHVPLTVLPFKFFSLALKVRWFSVSIIQQIFFKKIGLLLLERQIFRAKKRQRSSTCRFTSQISVMSTAEWIRNQVPGALPRNPTWAQGPTPLGHPPVLFHYTSWELGEVDSKDMNQCPHVILSLWGKIRQFSHHPRIYVFLYSYIYINKYIYKWAIFYIHVSIYT